MSVRAIGAVVVMLLAIAGATSPATAGGHDTTRATSLRTVEGLVVSVYSAPAEDDLQVVAATLDTGEANLETLEVLLAPQSVLEEIAFDVEQGDRLRARVFVADKGPLKVHKAMNLTRGTMVRFRSLREVPLWNTAGDWEGGACRQRTGRYGGGRQGRGQGPRR